jgi:Tol biopolymer transport system component
MSVTTVDGVELSSTRLQGMVWDFSPDGGQVAVTVNENNSWRVHIWDLASNQTRPLSPAGASCYRPAFTHDGAGLVYTHRSPDGIERIARVHLGDESFEFITEGPNDSHPAPHRTKPWLAFTRRNPGADPSEQVWTLGPDGVERAMPGRGAEPKWWD